MEACISDRTQDLKLTTLKDAKAAAFVLCSYSVMMLQFLYTPQKKKKKKTTKINKESKLKMTKAAWTIYTLWIYKKSSQSIQPITTKYQLVISNTFSVHRVAD